MNHHRHVLTPVIALALLSTLVVGCSPSPTPRPTPTAAFATEEEAFAAAEETYRAYIDALNQVDFAEPTTFEPVYALLQSSAASSTRKTFSQFHAESLRVTGTTAYNSFEGNTADLARGEIRARVCLDVTAVDVLDPEGRSVVSPERESLQPMAIIFRTDEAAELRISSLSGSEEFEC
ncbi:hypothetical protein [Microbacterium sp. LWH11-1.2]|uniref:hypothetical protein n=1 Tax=Microbacterium sp. LWH11-1.2 TaxID=3135258 RepID=UPI0031395CD6